MAHTTLTGVLNAMRRLGTASSGRLDGINLLDDAWRMPALKSGAPGWPDDLNALLTDQAAGTVTGDAPAYIVFSDGFPVCWYTYDAVSVAPKADLSRNQAKHRDLAEAALRDLARHVLGRLADLRDVREGRPHDVDSGDPARRHRMVRVADLACPSRAWWVPVGAGPREAGRRVLAETGVSDVGQVLVLAAHGYGDYGRHAHRPQLNVLCAINAAAQAHQVTGNAVGDWLAAEGGLTAPIPADEVASAFTDAFAGVFRQELAYTEHRIEASGWAATLRELGAIRFFDTAAYNRHLFQTEVRAVTNSVHDVVVCRRHRPS